MLSRLQKQLDAEPKVMSTCGVSLEENDIRACKIADASLVVLNLTLQFVPVEDRPNVLSRIYDGLLPGGALLLAEKLRFDNAAQQSLLSELHHDFKRAHGYSELEIAEKRTAIENRLIPETMDEHFRRLQGVGFRNVVPWFQCFNFASFLALKD